MATDNSGGPQLWGVIPAAGSGERMGADRPKQYLKVHGRCVLEHSIRALSTIRDVKGVMVVVAEHDAYWPQLGLNKMNIYTCIGGATRAHSVLNGLRALAGTAGEEDWVLVHDAARPNVNSAEIRRLIDNVAWETDGGLLALPVNDTLKRERGQRSQETVNREHLWRAQTPQLFPLAVLTRALDQALVEQTAITDEANAMELLGFRPKLVPGSDTNIKITYPEDIDLVESYLGGGGAD